MFFSKNPTIIYLQKNGFLLYSKNHPDGIELKFPDLSIKDDAIIDTNKFSDALQTFMAENSLEEDNVVIVLSADIISQKVIDGTTPEEQQKEVDAYIASSGIPEQNLAKETFELDTKKYILITNKNFYQNIASQLQNIGWTILSVIPISLFRDISDSKMKKNGINQKELQEIYKNMNLIKAANMMPEKATTSSTVPNIPDTKPRSFSVSKSSIIIVMVILMLGGVIFLYTQGIFSTLFNKTPQPAPIVKVEPTVTPTPIPTEDDKTKLTVNILNGTGTVGQAGKVKARLEKLDYTDIKTANGDTKTNTITSITFSSKVSEDYQEEITKDLKVMFDEVKIEDTKEESSFDIVILTGEEVK